MLSPEDVNYSIQALTSHHNRNDFSCGIETLDRYLKKQANQDKKKYVSAPFVAVDLKAQRIIGYYTLSATSINLDDLPQNIAKKLPKYPLVPAILLGRLAIDLMYQKQGWGDLLLMDALYRSFNNELAAVGVIVEAINPQAIAFYQRYNFQLFPDMENKLLLPMTVIKTIFE